VVGSKQEHVSRVPFSVGESKMSSRNIMVALAAIAGGPVIFFALHGRRNTSGSTGRIGALE